MLVYLIFFFVSLIGIGLMLGRKVSLVRGIESHPAPMQILDHPFIPDFETVKHVTNTHARKFGFLTLVVLIRYYVKISIWLRVKYEMVKMRIRSFRRRKNKMGEVITEAEENAFLKMISEYKYRIREIRDRIHEEEKIK
jgi:hypothetical protein